MSDIFGMSHIAGLAGLGVAGLSPAALQNTYVAPPKDRSIVTMFKPLEPWPGPMSFHRTLAYHIHNVTRVARRNEGIAESEEDAVRFDLPPVDYERAGQ